MKKKFDLVLAVLIMLATACTYDDSNLWNAVNEQEERITALENWQKTTNENIAAIQVILNESDYITNVDPIVDDGDTIGYSISFYKQGKITIYNGLQGEKGDEGTVPSIGVIQLEDGKWYWTLNGELLKDDKDIPICANGKDGEVYFSTYSSGENGKWQYILVC